VTGEPVVDWRGVEIEPGATVIYATSLGSAKYTVEGIVCSPVMTRGGGHVRVKVCRISHRFYRANLGTIVRVAPEHITVLSPPA
jgi:hypothetical protein